MTPGLPRYFHSTLCCPLCLSSQRPSENSNKRHKWEWAESGMLRGKLIYLSSVSAGLDAHCFSSRSHFKHTPPSLPPPFFLSFPFFPPHLSLQQTLLFFLAPRSDFKFSPISLGGIVRRTAPHVLRDAKKHNNNRRRRRRKKNKIAWERFQLWPSGSDGGSNMLQDSSQGTVSWNNRRYKAKPPLIPREILE